MPLRHTLRFMHMRIKEACEATGLTRKAIRYYETVGLISPDIDSQGYRNYSQPVVRQLALIGALRGFRLSIEEIRECLRSEQALLAQLDKKSGDLSNERERLSVELQLLQEFVAGGRTMDEIADLRQRVEASLTDRPGYLCGRLQQLFPGDFGETLAALYGSMLDQNLETPEQHAAWLSLVEELDTIEPIEVPAGVAQWARQRKDNNRIAENAARMRDEYSKDYESFAQHKRDAIAEYLKEPNAAEELGAFAERSKIVAAFLAGPGLPISLAVGKYLPALSTHFANFAEKGQRFIRENPDVVGRMLGPEH